MERIWHYIKMIFRWESVKRIWHYILLEPLTWIFYCFFQPRRFQSEFETKGFSKRIVPMLRLALPIFIISFPVAFISRGSLCALFPELEANCFSINEFSVPNTIGASLLLSMAWSTILGIVWGIMWGIGGRIIVGIQMGIVGGIALGTQLGFVGGIVGTIALIIVLIIVSIVALLNAMNLIEGDKVGVTGGIVTGIAIGITVSITSSIQFNIDGGIVLGLIGGFVAGMIFVVSHTIGYYRLPLYLISSTSTLMAYLVSRRNPLQVFTLLHRSSLYWDEYEPLPLPCLTRILLIAIDQDIEQTLTEINFIVYERPQQLRAAKAASLEIVFRDLEIRSSLSGIAQAFQQFEVILPQEVGLIDPRWVRPFARLNDASRDAARYSSSLGKQARRDALEDMVINLKRIYPNTALVNTHLMKRLEKVINRWLALAQIELEKLEEAPQKTGQIDNPFISGQVLELGNSLFVGRRYLIQQLEEALSRGNSRPTFFLYGERRMGKSSTLKQLPNMLGAHYLPILYDLQLPGILSSTAAFLGTVAEEIYKTMTFRGILARKLEYASLKEAGKENEAAAYRLFDEWLKKLERTLEQEDRILLLLFDEFEKLEETGQAEYLDLRLLLDWFRSVIQSRPRFALLFSGVHTLGEMGTKTGINWAGYFVNVQTLKVSFLQPSEAYKLITQPVLDFPGGEIFSTRVIDEIIQVTGCHPFLMQAICSALIDNLNAENRAQVVIQDVAIAVDQVLESWWYTYFWDLWQRTDQNQRACLFAIRKLGEGDSQKVSQQNGLDEKTVRGTLQILLKRDLVLHENGIYRIAAPIFSEWVERNT